VSRNPEILLRAFKVYVRPLLEYATCVWSPHYIYAIDNIEAVQRKFTKRLKGCKDMEYPAPSPAEPRERVVKVWKSLPPSIVHFSVLATFRNSLNKSALEYILNINVFSLRVLLVC